MKCLICGKKCKNNSSLAGHLGRGHKMSLEEYYEKHVYSGQRPKCPICGDDTRFDRVTKTFKKYCVKHANEARREWSKNKKTLNYGWKKGLTKKDHPGIAEQARKMSGENNPWFGGLPVETIQKASEARVKKLTLTSESFRRKANLIHNQVYDYSFVRYVDTLTPVEIVCPIHGVFLQKPREHIQGCGCPKCSNVGPSVGEQEVFDFIKSLGCNVRGSDRFLIEPQEVDIFVPSCGVAFEYNGLRWHSSQFREDKKYHLSKTKACLEKGVNLFHIFSDEWRDKREIIQSMIRHKLGKTQRKIYARKCVVQELENNSAKLFFERTHISGHVPARKTFALLYEGNVVAALSLRKPWQKKYGNAIEIARFSSDLNTVVVGGFQKLLKHVVVWAAKENFDSILTYADRRFGTGAVYERADFENLGSTQCDYWYTDGLNRFGRFRYRARDGQTEKQIAEDAGVFKIWGCGSNIYQMNLTMFFTDAMAR